MAEAATEAEVSRARAQLKSGLLMGLERPGTRAEMIAGQIFNFGRVAFGRESDGQAGQPSTPPRVRRYAALGSMSATEPPAIASPSVPPAMLNVTKFLHGASISRHNHGRAAE